MDLRPFSANTVLSLAFGVLNIDPGAPGVNDRYFGGQSYRLESVERPEPSSYGVLSHQASQTSVPAAPIGPLHALSCTPHRDLGICLLAISCCLDNWSCRCSCSGYPQRAMVDSERQRPAKLTAWAVSSTLKLEFDLPFSLDEEKLENFKQWILTELSRIEQRARAAVADVPTSS